MANLFEHFFLRCAMKASPFGMPSVEREYLKVKLKDTKDFAILQFYNLTISQIVALRFLI